MADFLCHRSFFSYKDNTTPNVWIIIISNNNNSSTLVCARSVVIIVDVDVVDVEQTLLQTLQQQQINNYLCHVPFDK